MTLLLYYTKVGHLLQLGLPVETNVTGSASVEVNTNGKNQINKNSIVCINSNVNKNGYLSDDLKYVTELETTSKDFYYFT